VSEITAFPLSWPHGWRRTAEQQRDRAHFGKSVQQYRQERDSVTGITRSVPSWKSKTQLSVAEAVNRVLAELERMDIERDFIIISTNVELRLDGLPRSNRRAPKDPGAAVYWREGRRGPARCMAIDIYDRVEDNLAAIAATIEAMRAIERHGGAEILDRAFTGFAALPAPKTEDAPHEILGVDEHATPAEIEYAYRRLAQQCHPDRDGGSTDAMSRINTARDAMLGGAR
jgi:hypothetical protein